VNGSEKLAYVLVTPARNEEAFIELTIKSVIAQTVLPLRWVIVSDGSTDNTDEIVTTYASRYEWIELLRMPERTERHFGGKVDAFDEGYERARNLKYYIIGNLDADISFEKDYFAFLLDKFGENPRLGVGGTPFVEGGSQYNYRYTSIEHVSGACQLFRRECFESIGGYRPFKKGGVDLVAVTMARMHGWETRTFSEKHCIHHRKMGAAKYVPLYSRFRDGQKDYTFGAHPLWEAFRVLYQMSKKPYVFGGIALFWGYVLSALCKIERPVPDDFISFRQKEQMQRLRTAFHRLTPFR
jgi:glycosyltransferase involved in cell wall biosynthesis